LYFVLLLFLLLCVFKLNNMTNIMCMRYMPVHIFMFYHRSFYIIIIFFFYVFQGFDTWGIYFFYFIFTYMWLICQYKYMLGCAPLSYESLLWKWGPQINKWKHMIWDIIYVNFTTEKMRHFKASIPLNFHWRQLSKFYNLKGRVKQRL